MRTDATNHLISALSNDARELLLKRCVTVDMPLHSCLYVADVTPAYAYFLMSGMASIVTTMKDGMTAEVGVVGCEGVVGGLQLLGPAKTSSDAFMQLPGTALRIPLGELQKAFRSSEEIRYRILEFHQAQAITSNQIAGCNRLHEAEQRLARWLLMAQDLTQLDVLEMTQEYLGQMLGSRRTTVTLVAGALQRRGLIEYSRGRVKILNRPGMEGAACDCYGITKHLLHGLYREKFEVQ